MRADRGMRHVLSGLSDFVVEVIVVIIILGIMLYGVFYEMRHRVKEMGKRRDAR